MKLRLFLTFIRDLFAVLPGRARPEWQSMESFLPDRPTVIVVSGFAATQRSVAIIRKRLRKDGFNVLVLALDWQGLADAFHGLYRMAEKLSTLALRVKKDRMLAKQPLFLVAHSAGGLVARYYIQLLGGSHYCDALITVGTPHQGTWVAALGLFTHLILKAKCLLHMFPGSSLIRRINTTPWPKDTRMVSIHSRGDYLCYRSAARLPDGMDSPDDGPIHSVEIGGLSHSELLLSKRCYRLIRRSLYEAMNRPDLALASEKAPVDGTASGTHTSA